MFDANGDTRLDYRSLYEHVQTLSKQDFDERCATRDRVFRDQGITYRALGRGTSVPARPRSPRHLRVRVVADRTRCRAEGTSPRAIPRRRLRTGRDHASRDRSPATGRHVVTLPPGRVRRDAPPGGVRVHVAGIDLVRDAAGKMCVLEDNLRIPSGISYVVENRRAMTHVFPEMFAAHRVQPVSDYPVAPVADACARPRHAVSTIRGSWC